MTASCCSIARWPIGCRGSPRSSCTTRIHTSSFATMAGSSTSRTPTRLPNDSRTARDSIRANSTRRRGADRSRRVVVQLPSQQREDRRRRLRRHDDLLRQRPGRPAHPRVAGRLPHALQADDRLPGRPPPSPAGAGGALQRPDAGLRPLPRPERGHVLRQRGPLDRATRADVGVQPAERGVLRDHVPAGGRQSRVPAPPADDPERSAEHDCLGRGPERRR